MIEQRSGKDFDNAAGPVVICVSLIVALCLNFGFKVGKASAFDTVILTHNSTEWLSKQQIGWSCQTTQADIIMITSISRH